MIRLIQGSDESVRFEFFEDLKETTPSDLTDATPSIVDTDLPSSPTVAITDAANGIVTVSWTDAQTAAMKKHKQYSFQIMFSYPGDIEDQTPEFFVVAE